METIYAPIVLNFSVQDGNLAICEAPDGTLLWTKIPTEFSEPGSALPVPELRLLDALSPEEQARILALMAITGWLLSNPKGYRAPAGGLKAQLKRYFRAGSRFEKDWDVFTRYHLKLTRAPIDENRFYTFYDLYWRPTPEEIAENGDRAAEPTAVSRKEQTSAIHDTEAGTKIADSAEERKAVQELVEDNIGYTQLLRAARTAPLYYRAEDIDGYVRLIADTVCSTLPTVRIGGQNLPTQRVREVLLQLIRNTFYM